MGGGITAVVPREGFHSQDGERERCRSSAHFLLFIWSEIMVHGMVLPTFRVGLLILNNPIWEPYRHTRKLII